MLLFTVTYNDDLISGGRTGRRVWLLFDLRVWRKGVAFVIKQSAMDIFISGRK